MPASPDEYEPRAGESIEAAIRTTVALANERQRSLTLVFNDNLIPVAPGADAAAILKKFHDDSEAQREAYLNSDAYRQEQARQARAETDAQRAVDQLVTDMPAALKKGLNATIHWLKSYADAAADAPNYRGDQVLAAFEGAGFETNGFTGDKFVHGDKNIMGRYIIGQVMANLESGYRPMGVAGGFCDQYLAMKDPLAPMKPVTFKPPKR